VTVAFLFYINLDDQIQKQKHHEKSSNTKCKKLGANKKMNDANNVIHNQELEIQSLKYKDSLRRFKKW
jgi:hypothetical protein